MVIECPNLISACRDFLEDPEGASGPGPESRRTMWVLYGDPAWRDPLMVHRWGYTPGSLGRLMAEAGLVNIRQEPAEFKLRMKRNIELEIQRDWLDQHPTLSYWIEKEQQWWEEVEVDFHLRGVS